MKLETNELLQQILDNQVETNRKIVALEANMEERFAQVEERFGQVDKQFAQVERRFVQMEERFAQVEKRLDKVEEKIELLTSQTTQAYHDLVEIITNQKEDITQNFTPLVETAFWADKTLHLEKEIYKLKQQHS
jgi:predicted nuclease with TOPRIM domain